MRKHRKPAAAKRPAQPSVFNDEPAHDDPHDAIEQELLGIWLSVSRLREMIRDKPPADSRVIPLKRQPAHKKAHPKKSTPKKPRRKAA